VRLDQLPYRAALGDGPTTSCDYRPHRLHVERLLGQDLFQSAILVFELPQALDVAKLEPAYLAFQR
jgi:hypothetical protein